MNDIELSPSLKRRVSEDFDFLVLCQSKGNMGMYRKSSPARVGRRP